MHIRMITLLKGCFGWLLCVFCLFVGFFLVGVCGGGGVVFCLFVNFVVCVFVFFWEGVVVFVCSC